MKTNITLTSLYNPYNNKIGKITADIMNLYFADVQELMEYNFINDDVTKICGIEYLNTLQQRTIKDISGYDNSLFSIDYKFLLNNENVNDLKVRSLIVYLNLGKEFIDEQKKTVEEKEQKAIDVEILAYEEHDNMMRNIADIVVNVEKLSDKNVAKKIEKAIEKYYL